jgi:hypothetical protein
MSALILMGGLWTDLAGTDATARKRRPARWMEILQPLIL